MSQVHAEGGRAEVHDRTALQWAIIALVLAALALLYVTLRLDALEDRLVKVETDYDVVNDTVHEIKGAMNVKTQTH